MSFPLAVAVYYKGGADCSIPQAPITRQIMEVVLPAFKMRFSEDMLRHLSCSFPSYSGEEVKIVVTALELNCKRGQALAQVLVKLGVEMVPSRQFVCEVVCLEGKFTATSLEPALQRV